MNKLLKFLVAIVFATVLSANIFAYDFVVDGIYYNINSDGATVSVTYQSTNFYSYSGSVIIPSTVTYNATTYSVTSIGSSAFSNYTNLSILQIGTSVDTIGDRVFYKCSSLDSIYCRSLEPPVLGSGVFGSTDRNTIILTVPCGKQSAYQAADGWSLFANIEEDCSDSHLDDAAEKNTVSLYPNPAKENITLTASEDIFIYNNLGQIVKQIRNPKGETTINISDLPKGTYYVKSGYKQQKLIKE